MLTGDHKVYNKAASLKGAKQLTSSSQLKKLAGSVRSKDTFRVYRMAATRNHRVYYKVVSFEGKYRGWIYGGKAKRDYAGGLERVNTTSEVTLSDQIRQTTYHLKSSGTSSDENVWNDIPWTQYKASLKTKDSTPYAKDDLTVISAKKMTRQYYQTYYYIEDAQHPEFNGWINSNSLEGPATTVTKTVSVPGPTQTVTVPGASTTVTVPAKNSLTINYVTNRYDPSAKTPAVTEGNGQDWPEEPQISKSVQKAYQEKFKSALAEIQNKSEITQADLDALGNGKVFWHEDDAWGDWDVSIRVSYDKLKNVVTINLVWEDVQTTWDKAVNYYLHIGDKFTPWDLIHDFVYEGYFVDTQNYAKFFTVTENTVDTSKAGNYVVKYYMKDYPNNIITVPVTVQSN
ncbi:hypothetical protein LBUCD034_1999 [Lentilactobacillus buchneri subsp. silagei CD034]|uniref:S-layer protein n=2 Tax=Lentilactobacillus buchneri TaxID=1581 RepID=J9W3F1_LENBU|nr:hypothetical protein LBUCD034_1999 [Lentilactobacillus buchneri subsp. silagei CD034]